MDRLVEIDIADGIATVAVANPPVNVLSDAVLHALGHAARGLAADPDVRCVVLTGAGERSFVAGADLEAFADALGDARAMAAHAALTADVFAAWAALPIPVVAAMRGHAMGGGLELALVCDLLVADPRARLGTPEVTLGLIPGAGGTQRLGRRVGPAAHRMILLGEPVDAATALRLGLVDVVAAPGAALHEARALAARLAALPAQALRAAKAALRAADTLPLADGLVAERALFLDVAATADAREGATAFIAKRPPEFIHA
jgi:enoyl-CoA hydratase/carnithine racemase